MNKIIKLISAMSVIVGILFSLQVEAAELSNFSIFVTKTEMEPGQNIKMTINFGEDMSKYIVDVAYDNKLFGFGSVTGGTATDDGQKIRIDFEDPTLGSNSSNQAVLILQAKTDIITTVPTDFSVTANTLVSGDGNTRFDDITIPVVHEVIIKPVYTDYEMELVYPSELRAVRENAMTLNITSSLGENFNKTRIIAEAKTPDGETVKLLGKDYDNEDFDLIQNGYGDPSGDQIGGSNVLKSIDFNAVFSEKGEYEVTFKLINREDSDNVIVQETVTFDVIEQLIIPGTPLEPATPTEPDEELETNGNEEEEEEEEPEIEAQTEEDENDEEIEIEETEIPEELPEAGNSKYASLITTLSILATVYAYTSIKNKQ